MDTQEHARRRAAPLLAAVLVAALLAPPALAQEAAKKAAAPKTAPKGKANVMTRDELRACLAEQDRLQGIRAKIEQDTAALDRQKADVRAMDEALQKKTAGLDPSDEAARKALEDEGAARDEAADAYNSRLSALREQGKTYDGARQAWADKCANRAYDEMDEAAIRKEQRARAAREAKK